MIAATYMHTWLSLPGFFCRCRYRAAAATVADIRSVITYRQKSESDEGQVSRLGGPGSCLPVSAYICHRCLHQTGIHHVGRHVEFRSSKKPHVASQGPPRAYCPPTVPTCLPTQQMCIDPYSVTEHRWKRWYGIDPGQPSPGWYVDERPSID